jgi:PKD repeat protein
MTLWIYALPEAKTTANITATTDSTVWFNGTGNDADGEITLYEWDLDGDGIFEWSSSENGITSHIYGNSGIYATVLRITDNDGFSAFDSRIITIELPEDDNAISILILAGTITIIFTVAAFLRMKLK